MSRYNPSIPRRDNGRYVVRIDWLEEDGAVRTFATQADAHDAAVHWRRSCQQNTKCIRRADLVPYLPGPPVLSGSGGVERRQKGMPTRTGLYERGDEGPPPVMTQCVAGRWYEVYQLPRPINDPDARRRWRVVCVGHRELIIVDTLAEVQGLLDTPAGWCWRCHVGLDAKEKSYEQRRVEQRWVHQIDAQLTAEPEGIIVVRDMHDVDSPAAWLRRVPESQTIDVVLLRPSGRKSVTVATLEDVFDLLAWFAPGGEDWVVRPPT